MHEPAGKRGRAEHGLALASTDFDCGDERAVERWLVFLEVERDLVVGRARPERTDHEVIDGREDRERGDDTKRDDRGIGIFEGLERVSARGNGEEPEDHGEARTEER